MARRRTRPTKNLRIALLIETSTSWGAQIVRGIGDSLTDPLPPGCDHWVDHHGQTARKEVALALLRRPTLLRRIRELQRTGEMAMRGVAEVLAQAFRGEHN